MKNLSRREFVLSAAAAAAGLGMAMGGAAQPSYAASDAAEHPLPQRWKGGVKIKPIELVRIGVVGVGNMGTNHVRSLINIPGCEVRAICDINEEYAKSAAELVKKAGFARPKLYTKDEYDFQRMCEKEDLDLVLTATPWHWHVPVCVAAMENGKHAATEVPAALTVDDCWKLVETSEKTNRHCMMLENCCYSDTEMTVLEMVRRGAMGNLLHAECGYNHDLREIKLGKDHEGLWRWKFSIDHATGNLYPTHGLGPVGWCMDINRGNQFDYIVSMNSPAYGLNAWAKEHLPESDPRRKIDFQAGDVNTSLIKTKNGATVYLVHDCNSPRPYARFMMVQGSKGLYAYNPDRVYLEGRSKAGHKYEDLALYKEEFRHELWKKIPGVSDRMRPAFVGGGLAHGGMDYIETYRLVRALRNGLPLDMDVYDAAALSCIVELTVNSLTQRSKSIDFPDFTRGAWKTRKQLELVES